MLTVLAALVLATAPGALLALALPAGRDRWAAWAGAPALTLGLTGIAMGWLRLLGLPRGAGAVLVGEVVLAGAVVLAAWLRQRRRPARPPDPVRRCRPGTLDLVCLGVPAALALTLGVLLLRGFAAPPGWDAMNHALLTRNILQTGSTAVASACTSGYLHPVVSCAFYPLAVDVSWAQAALLTHGPISSAMAAWAVVVGPVQVVTSVYACVRVLGGRPVVAGAAAAATTLVGPLYASMLTGRAPEQAGPGLSVAVALLVALAVRGRSPFRLGLLAGMGVAGIVLTHTYDVLFAVVLAAGLLVWVRGRLTARSAAWTLGAVAATTVVALVPFVATLLGAGGERDAAPPRLRGQLAEAWTYWVTDLQRYVPLGYPAPGGSPLVLQMAPVQVAVWAVVACLLASPLCLALPGLRWARPWLLAYVVWTAVGIWTSVSGSAAALMVSGLWYGTRERIRTMVLPVYGVLAVAGACAIATALHRLARLMASRIRRRGRPDGGVPAAPAAPAGPAAQAAPAGRVPTGVTAAVAAVLLVTLVAAVALLPDTRAPLRGDLARRAPVGASYARTFTWLARSTPPGGVAAYDRHLEMMTWSWADAGVRPLFGIPPLREEDRADYDQRLRAWDWLVANPGAAPAGCLVRHYGVQYVVVGRARVPGWPAHYSRPRLAASPRVDLVHRDGGIRVYAVNAAGRACPAGR